MLILIIKIRRFLFELSAVLKGLWVKLIARIFYRDRMRIGKGLKIYGPLPLVHCSSGCQITIGDHVVMRNNTKNNYIGILKPTSIVALDGAKIHIGSYVGLSGTSICAYRSIQIMDFATIGANVFIVDSDFHSLDPSVREADSRSGRHPDMLLVKSEAVIIGKRAFIGLNSIILRGAKIGEGAVVGAGTLIAGSVPDCCIAMGPKYTLRDIEPRN